MGSGVAGAGPVFPSGFFLVERGFGTSPEPLPGFGGQPDLAADPDVLEAEVVSYRATATRTGKQWTAVARDLTGIRAFQAQGTTWAEVRNKIADSVGIFRRSDGDGARAFPATNDLV